MDLDQVETAQISGHEFQELWKRGRRRRRETGGELLADAAAVGVLADVRRVHEQHGRFGEGFWVHEHGRVAEEHLDHGRGSDNGVGERLH